MSFGSGELILIFCVALLLFGGKRLPELAKSLGKGIREFKKACNGEEGDTPTTISNKDPKLPEE